MLTIQMQSAKLQGMQFDMDLKNLMETSAAKLEAIKASLAAQDIQQFLDYEKTEKTVDVPIQVTIPAEDASEEEANDLNRYLQQSTTKVKYQDWDGTHSLQDQMIDLLNAAAMIRANFFEVNK